MGHSVCFQLFSTTTTTTIAVLSQQSLPTQGNKLTFNEHICVPSTVIPYLYYLIYSCQLQHELGTIIILFYRRTQMLWCRASLTIATGYLVSLFKNCPFCLYFYCDNCRVLCMLWILGLFLYICHKLPFLFLCCQILSISYQFCNFAINKFHIYLVKYLFSL